MAKNNDFSGSKAELAEPSDTKFHYLVVGLVIFVMVTILGLILLRMTRHKQQPVSQDAGSFHETPTTPAEKSYAYQLSGQYNEAYKLLDEAINKAGTDKEKADLYNEKSIAALNAKDYAFALEMAKQSEKLSPSISSAHIIAESAEQTGDKKTAVGYLKKQVERTISSGKPYVQEDIDALRQKITQLEAKT